MTTNRYSSNHTYSMGWGAGAMTMSVCNTSLQVVRVKDSSNHTYSIPLYSTIRIGMVQEVSAGEAVTGKAGVMPSPHHSIKTNKVADILAMKVVST